jgi:hypothetical protein
MATDPIVYAHDALTVTMGLWTTEALVAELQSMAVPEMFSMNVSWFKACALELARRVKKDGLA